jgi:hypothetical protein
MAELFNPNKFTVHTQDLEAYSDFLTNFDEHPELHDLARKRNEDAVKMAIRNLISTNKYDRPFQPTLGSNLRNYLFEPVNVISQVAIEQEIRTVISNYEPRANLMSVTVTPLSNESGYTVTIVFSVLNITKPVVLNTILYRVR